MKILLIAYDNGSYIQHFPLGIAYIAGALKKEGYDVTIYNQDKFHYPEEHLTAYLDKNHFDVVGLGIIAGYYEYRKILKISDAINHSKQRPFYVIGGHGPSPEPEYFLKKTKADAAVLGEGEETIKELLKTWARKGSFHKIKGIAFREGDKGIINDKREVIKDVDSIPWPAYDLFPIDYYKLIRVQHASKTDYVMDILSGRGCPFNCTFCYRIDKGFRPRKNEHIIEEIKFLKNNYNINYFSFADELLMSSEARTISLCEDFIKAQLNIKWRCSGRLNYARSAVLKTMKKAGCVFINYGIEAMDNEVLKKMNKHLTTDMIITGVEATLKAGISPGLNIIFGNLGDNKKTLNKGVKFLLKYSDAIELRTIRPVTPYPGCPLYYYAIEKGLLVDVEDFYENKHINSDLIAVNFTDLNDEEVYQALLEANTKLIKDYYKKKSDQMIDRTKKLYLNKDSSFRGFRQT
ncbi:MAG: B12-binding domain-containing radical SAM protein [Spirochaetes bacterium]|nr:B12-binding domain-containing radical SAM protein [Spirochaetota bacterium]